MPKQHRTDSLSAARNLGGQRKPALTTLYDQLCDHYRLQPTRNNRGIAHENGSIESPHGHLKHRIKQAILLRGSSDFASIEDYQALIDKAVAGLNRRSQAKYEEEKQVLQALPQYRVADYEVVSARVSCHSTIEVCCMLYTVPSRLIGRTLELHLYHDRIVGYLAHQVVVELPRIRATDKQKRRARCINYRHVIEGLRRKPRAFLYCTWQQNLLPNDDYRQLWEQLKAHYDLDSAALLMVEALYIAATQDKEGAVAHYLHTQLDAKTLTLVGLQEHFQLLQRPPIRQVNVTQHELSSYDQLLSPRVSDTPAQPLPELQSLPQATTPLPYAGPVGGTRTTGDAGGMVVRPILAGTMRIGGTTPLEYPPQARPHRGPTAKRKNPFQL